MHCINIHKDHEYVYHNKNVIHIHKQGDWSSCDAMRTEMLVLKNILSRDQKKKQTTAVEALNF